MIVTFYSFKGGVGRSMAMANIGTWLYQQGMRVLLVDWDLEAPGLESFFPETTAGGEEVEDKAGIVDLIESYRQLWDQAAETPGSELTESPKVSQITEQIGRIQHLYIPLANTASKAIGTREPGLWLFSAGRRAGDSHAFYTRAINALDWSELYDEYGGYEFLEWLRRQLINDVDLVLIDSRTGLTEMGGVCTQHLADMVMCFLAPNDTNLRGVHKIIRILLSNELRNLRGVDRPIQVLPIPTRVDTQGASEELTRFERAFRDLFAGYRDINVDWCWDSKIRYVTRYSYVEEVVFLSDSPHRDLVEAYERIGMHILRRHKERLSLDERQTLDRHQTSGRRASRSDRDLERTQETVHQLIDAGGSKLEQGEPATAMSLLQSAVRLAESDLGEEHPETLSAINNLAAATYQAADYSAAISLLERVQKSYAKLRGEQHPETLTAMSNLAATLRAQGDLTGARALHEQVLDSRRRLLGEEHPDTLTTMSNLAATLGAQGDLAGARALHEQVLDSRRRLLGEEHPDTLTTMSNLAETLRDLGDLAQARALEEQVLETSRRVLGEEHPDTLTSMGNLAHTLWGMREPTEALHMMQAVADGFASILGSEHPEAIASRQAVEQMKQAKTSNSKNTSVSRMQESDHEQG